MNKKNLKITKTSWRNSSKSLLKRSRQDNWNIWWWCGTIILRSQPIKKSTTRWSKSSMINFFGKLMLRRSDKWKRSLKTKRLLNNKRFKESRLQTLMQDHLWEQLQMWWSKISQKPFNLICRLLRSRLSLNRKFLSSGTNLISRSVERRLILSNNNMLDCWGVSNLESPKLKFTLLSTLSNSLRALYLILWTKTLTWTSSQRSHLSNSSWRDLRIDAQRLKPWQVAQE